MTPLLLRAGVLGFGAVAVLVTLAAATIPVADVRTADGAICGSAWRASDRQVGQGGERTAAQRDADADACQRAGEAALREIPWLLGIGAVAAGSAVVIRSRSPRTSASPAVQALEPTS